MNQTDEVVHVATVLAVGLPLLFTCGAGLWALAPKRGKLAGEWKDQLDLAKSSLNDQAISELNWLREKLDDFLDPDDPTTVAAAAASAPDPLVDHAKKAVKHIHDRKRVDKTVEQLRWIFPRFSFCLVGVAAADILLMAYFSELADWATVRTAGWILLGLAGAPGIVLLGIYLFLANRLGAHVDAAQSWEVDE